MLLSSGLTFWETPLFSRDRDAYFGDDEAFRLLQNELMKNPTQGKVIPDSGNIRKMRWSDPRRGKGKRGGLRVLYVFIPEAATVAFLLVYDKDKRDDLTPQQRRVLTAIADGIKDDVRKANR